MTTSIVNNPRVTSKHSINGQSTNQLATMDRLKNVLCFPTIKGDEQDAFLAVTHYPLLMKPVDFLFLDSRGVPFAQVLTDRSVSRGEFMANAFKLRAFLRSSETHGLQTK
ncbi:hypothetical protein TNCV_2548471 [Trichonephila clavipes]|nr:hypothetical protein TNCV_2548471 [Trichonephila clavipes]